METCISGVSMSVHKSEGSSNANETRSGNFLGTTYLVVEWSDKWRRTMRNQQTPSLNKNDGLEKAISQAI